MFGKSRVVVEGLRERYPEGTRVELQWMDDPQSPPPGTVGVVKYVDDIGTIHVKWENGSSLGLVYGLDSFRAV